MLDRIPKWSRWLAWGILIGSLLGIGGRIYISGEGIERDQELFFGLMDHLPAAQYLDTSIIVVGVLTAAYLFAFSYATQRLLQSSWRPFWLYLHLSLTILLLIIPLHCYSGWRPIYVSSGGYVGRLLPVIDDLTRHDFKVMFRVDFSLAAAFLYGSLLNTTLLLYGLYHVLTDHSEDESPTAALDEHLVR